MMIFKKNETQLGFKLAKSQVKRIVVLENYAEVSTFGMERLDLDASIDIDEMEIDKLYRCL